MAFLFSLYYSVCAYLSVSEFSTDLLKRVARSPAFSPYWQRHYKWRLPIIQKPGANGKIFSSPFFTDYCRKMRCLKAANAAADVMIYGMPFQQIISLEHGQI